MKQAPPVGRQVTLWSWSEPGKLYLVPLARNNPVSRLAEFVEGDLNIEANSYTLAALIPKASYPVPLMRFSSDLDRGIILCLPTHTINVTLENSLRRDQVFSVAAKPLQTVFDLKASIAKAKGFPVSRQDLLHKGHALLNHKQLLDYNIKDGDKMLLILQPGAPFVVIVDTFWGRKYNIDANSCMFTGELLLKCLKRVFTNTTQAEDILKQDSLFRQHVFLQFDGQILDKDHCLQFYKIKHGVTVKMVSVGEFRHDNHRKLKLLAEDETSDQITAAPYDTFFVVGLKAHGPFKIPLDKMQILVNDHRVELSDNLGVVRLEDEFAHVRVLSNKVKEEYNLEESVLISVKLPNARSQALSCKTSAAVHSIMEQVEDMGFPKATYYELVYKGVRLPGNTAIADYRLPPQCQMGLKLYEIPLSITQANHIVDLTVDYNQSVGSLVRQVEDQFSCSSIKTCLVHCGIDLYDKRTTIIKNAHLFINSKLFIESIPVIQVLHLVIGTDIIPLTTKPNMDALCLQQLGNTCSNVESFIEGFQWFVKWRFPEKTHMQLVPHRNKPLSHTGTQNRTADVGSSLHKKLDAVREEARKNTAPHTQDTLQKGQPATDPHRKAVSKIATACGTQEENDKATSKNGDGSDTKLPSIQDPSDGSNTQPVFLTAPKRSRRHKENNTPTSNTSSSYEGGYRLDTGKKKHRSVRFDIPNGSSSATSSTMSEELGKISKLRASPRANELKPRPIWHDSKAYLEKQAKTSRSRSLYLERSTTETCLDTRGPHTPRGFQSYRAHQTYPIPKWHHSQQSANQNFTNRVKLNGGLMNALPLKPSSSNNIQAS